MKLHSDCASIHIALEITKCSTLKFMWFISLVTKNWMREESKSSLKSRLKSSKYTSHYSQKQERKKTKPLTTLLISVFPPQRCLISYECFYFRQIDSLSAHFFLLFCYFRHSEQPLPYVLSCRHLHFPRKYQIVDERVESMETYMRGERNLLHSEIYVSVPNNLSIIKNATKRQQLPHAAAIIIFYSFPNKLKIKQEI